MTKRKSDFTLPMNSLDELFSSQEERDDAKLERVKEIQLNELHPFRDHPFKIQNDEEMKRLRPVRCWGSRQCPSSCGI